MGPSHAAHDAVADGKAADAFTKRLHHASDLATGRERQWRFELVIALDDQRVGEIHATGVHTDTHLTWARLR